MYLDHILYFPVIIIMLESKFAILLLSVCYGFHLFPFSCLSNRLCEHLLGFIFIYFNVFE